MKHYYEAVNNGSPITWTKAYNEAKQRSYHNLTGYLATITSGKTKKDTNGNIVPDTGDGNKNDEQQFIYNSIAKNLGWLGGIRVCTGTDANSPEISDERSITPQNENSNTGGFAPGQVWYWADGPEGLNDKGEGAKQFYDYPTYDGNGRPPVDPTKPGVAYNLSIIQIISKLPLKSLMTVRMITQVRKVSISYNLHGVVLAVTFHIGTILLIITLTK